MSDEVRSSSITAPADAGGETSDSVDGPKLPRSGFPVEEDVSGIADAGQTAPDPSADLPALSPSAAPPPLPVPLPVLVVEVPPQVLLHSASEAPPPRHSERPPPPSQRASARPEPLGAKAVNGDASEGPALPPPASLKSTPPPARPSDPAPPTVRRSVSAPPTPRVSSLPPGLVEPKRIIEVLGSNVPVLDKAWEEETIEDLDESEAYEVSETPVPESSGPDSAPELEVSLEVDDHLPSIGDGDDDASRGNAGSAESAGVEVAFDGLESANDDGAGSESRDSAQLDAAASDGSVEPHNALKDQRAKVPPKRRRPPPPPTRANEKPKAEFAVGVAAGARKWWEEMFCEEFLRAIPILSARQLDREVNFIDEGLGVAPGGRILDLACGAGQHAVELAARGYDLVGFDLSQSQLDWAGGLAQERGQRLQFTYGDMRELSYQESFDAIYSWNTSFGFFEEEKNFDVAQRIFKALRPGGRFLLDVVNRDFVVSQQPGQTWFEGDGCVCIDDVSIDFITSRLRVKRTMMLTNGKNCECNYSVRMYDLHELGKILHDVGFKVLKVSGRPEMPGVFFGAASPRVIILAYKPPL